MSDEDSGINSGGEMVICVYVPHLEVRKYLQFSQADCVWMLKQNVLAELEDELPESFNYGLYYPPSNGKAGKFLDEGRCMSDYPLAGSVGHLELKYKSRVYKHLQERPKKLLHVNTKENQKKLMTYVTKGDVKKIQKLAEEGFDPNFIDQELGETPLTLAAVSLANPAPVLQALVGGGAHLDFRDTQAMTPLHRAAQNCNQAAIQALLALGSSANYQDRNGLTPLYYCIFNEESDRGPACVELLLFNHAAVDVVDDKGWTPLHQVCKRGKLKILDQLVYYEADINAQNSNGNTPLHIAAINNQEECARTLLFRGANKQILNHSNADAHKIAVMSQNESIARLIENFRPDDVVLIREKPSLNPKVRPQTIAIGMGQQRCSPCSTLQHQEKKKTMEKSVSVDQSSSNRMTIASLQPAPGKLPKSLMDVYANGNVPSLRPTDKQNGPKPVDVPVPPPLPFVAVAASEQDEVYSNIAGDPVQPRPVGASTVVWPPPPKPLVQDDAKEEYENLDQCVLKAKTSNVLSEFDRIFDDQQDAGQASKPTPPPSWMKPKQNVVDAGTRAGQPTGNAGVSFSDVAEIARRRLMQRRASQDEGREDGTQVPKTAVLPPAPPAGPPVQQQVRPSFPKVRSSNVVQTSTTKTTAPPVFDLKTILEQKAANRCFETPVIDEVDDLDADLPPPPPSIAFPQVQHQPQQSRPTVPKVASAGSIHDSTTKAPTSELSLKDILERKAANRKFDESQFSSHVGGDAAPGGIARASRPPPPVRKTSAPSMVVPGGCLPPPPEVEQPSLRRPPASAKKAPGAVVDVEGLLVVPPPPPPEQFANEPPTHSTFFCAGANRKTVAEIADVRRGPPRQPLPKFSSFTAAPAPPPPPSFSTDDEFGFLPPPPMDFSDLPPPAPPSSFAAAPAPVPTSSTTSGDRSMSDWSVDDVTRWLDGLNMSEHRAAFRNAGVDGRRLVTMSADDLYTLGVKQSGQSMIIGRAIKIALQD